MPTLDLPDLPAQAPRYLRHSLAILITWLLSPAAPSLYGSKLLSLEGPTPCREPLFFSASPLGNPLRLFPPAFGALSTLPTILWPHLLSVYTILLVLPASVLQNLPLK